MIVIAEDRDNSGSRLEILERIAKRAEVTIHRIRTGKIIAGQKYEIGMLLVDGLDRERESFEVFVAIDMKVADLTGDDSAQSSWQSAHRQFDLGHLGIVDRSPPHPMQLTHGEWRLPTSSAGRFLMRLFARRLVRRWMVY